VGIVEMGQPTLPATHGEKQPEDRQHIEFVTDFEWNYRKFGFRGFLVKRASRLDDEKNRKTLSL
jgi:hypothetical protein